MTEHVEQPLPIPNDQESVHDRVAAAILARKAVGVERYGVALQPFNGRNALRDASEEILDLSVYFQQLIDEQSPVTPLVNQAWQLIEQRTFDEKARRPLVQLYRQLSRTDRDCLNTLFHLLSVVETDAGGRDFDKTRKI